MIQIRNIIALAIAITFLVVTLFYSGSPAPVSEQAPKDVFSSGRAMVHLKKISEKPHPIGSKANDEVYAYLCKTIKEIGIEPEVQEKLVLNAAWSFHPTLKVKNVMARLKGSGDGKAVMISAHYDTVPHSQGAGDNGSAVAAMLEVLRILKNGPQLKHDVIFLFTDSEEKSLMGAQAFVENHPWASDVKLFMNFDARGAAGPVMLFETNYTGNSDIIREFDHHGHHQVGTSIGVSVYGKMGHNTDFSMLQGTQAPGLNFAMIDKASHYHTTLDKPENLSESSVQHQGELMLGLSRYFANNDLVQPSGKNVVFYSIPFIGFVHYSQAVMAILSILAAVAFIVVAVIGIRKKKITIGGMLLSILATILSLAVAALLCFVFWRVLPIFRPREYPLVYHPLFDKSYLLGFGVLALAGLILPFKIFQKKISAENFIMGSLTLWFLLNLVGTKFLNGNAAHMLSWPLTFSVISMGIVFFMDEENPNRGMIPALFAIPGFLFFAPFIFNVYLVLHNDMLWAVGPMLGLFLIHLLYPCYQAFSQQSFKAAAVIMLIAIGFLGYGKFSNNTDEYPHFNSLIYGYNADDDEAVWLSADPEPDEWTSQYIPAGSPAGMRQEFIASRMHFRSAPAEKVDLPIPEVEVVQDDDDGMLRTLRLRFKSPRGARTLLIIRESEEQVMSATVGDEFLGGDFKLMHYYGLPPEGIEMTFSLDSDIDLKLRVIDLSYGLPQEIMKTPEPSNMAPSKAILWSERGLIMSRSVQF